MAESRANLLARTFASLRIRNFRLFFIGQLISNSGNWLTTVSITLLVLHRTGSGASVGLLSVCQFGPLLVLSPFAGLVADRTNKRTLLYVTQGLEMAESFVLAWLAFQPHSPLPAFYTTAAVGGTLLAFDNPARRSFVNEMVGAEDVSNAVTLYSAMNSLSRVVGPTIAGALIVGLGYGWCFTIDGAPYLVVLAALVLMRPAELRRAPKTARGRGQVRAGLRYLVSVPELWITFGMLAIIGTTSYNFTVVLPLFVERGLHGSDLQYTLVYAAFSAGGVLGTLAVARRTAIGLRTIILSAGCFGVAMLGLFLVPDIGFAYPLAVLIGGTSVSYMTATTAIAQLRTDRAMIGRVLALQTVLLLGTTPIGGPILGVVADAAGGRTPVLVGGVAAIVAALLGLFAVRRLRVRDGLDPDRSEAAQSPESTD
ncbi:MAG TPA: MFS transporter [Pseudonocardiaceae bacterium]|jgi:MFS family permease|nr:MFS transporter [Pseudonocardiaceae bacterium]